MLGRFASAALAPEMPKATANTLSKTERNFADFIVAFPLCPCNAKRPIRDSWTAARVRNRPWHLDRGRSSSAVPPPSAFQARPPSGLVRTALWKVAAVLYRRWSPIRSRLRHRSTGRTRHTAGSPSYRLHQSRAAEPISRSRGKHL